MRSDSWCVATPTTGRCHWTRTAGPRLALPACFCGLVCVHGTRDGVAFSVSRKCSQRCAVQLWRTNPAPFHLPSAFRLFCTLSAPFSPPQLHLYLADVHAVNVGGWFHSIQSVVLVCSAAIYALNTVIPIVSYVTKRFFNCGIQKACPGVRHTQSGWMDWLKLLGWKSLRKASHQKHPCVNTNASVCAVIEPDWQNYHHPPVDQMHRVLHRDLPRFWPLWFRSQAKKGRGSGERDIYLHERSKHALKYHRFCSQCVCSTTHTHKSPN